MLSKFNTIFVINNIILAIYYYILVKYLDI